MFFPPQDVTIPVGPNADRHQHRHVADLTAPGAFETDPEGTRTLNLRIDSPNRGFVSPCVETINKG